MQRTFLRFLHQTVETAPTPAKWTPSSKRIGLVATKKGMVTLWDEWGKMHPATVLQVHECYVLATKTVDSQLLLQAGTGRKSPRSVPRHMLDFYEQCKVPPLKRVKEFPVTPDALLPPGTRLYAAHFVPGQLVDVQAISIGKGFQGVMKRWNFSGMPATHGVTKTHRKGGTIGSRSEPGKVFKGTKMPGRMGGTTVSTLRLKVLKIDNALNCIFVRGAVPGHNNQFVRVKDSKHNDIFAQTPPPFPTFIPDPSSPLPSTLVAPKPKKDPLLIVPKED